MDEDTHTKTCMRIHTAIHTRDAIEHTDDINTYTHAQTHKNTHTEKHIKVAQAHMF